MTEDRPEVAHPFSGFNLQVIGPEPEGATPLDEDDLRDLIPEFVSTRADLDLVEFENIVRAMPWALDQARRSEPPSLLDHSFLFRLHKRMFGDVWRWAGTQRRRVTNIGVEPHLIPEQVRQALDDAVYWHERTVFPRDELAARIHHQLVAVHPFPNGNGRCTRLLADMYLVSVDAPVFSWGAGGTLDGDTDPRRTYIEALLAADRGDHGPLIAFARA